MTIFIHFTDILATCNFEESQCGFDTSLTDNPSWTYVSGKNSTTIGDNSIAIPDHTKNTSMLISSLFQLTC